MPISTKTSGQEDPVALSAIPQGPGSGLDADTIHRKRPTDFLQLGASTGDRLYYKAITVNPGAVASAASATVSFTWNTTFAAAPVAWLGNVTSGSNSEKLILRITATTTTGGTLNVYNPTSGSITPNFTIELFGIGKV